MEAVTTGKWSGLPMSEKSFKEWQKAFSDIEDSINALYGKKKSKK